jgi:AraC-like DNA-binding protein
LPDIEVSTSEYVVRMPLDELKGWVCSYNGYREDVSQPVRRLEVPHSRVTLILGFGDRLQIASTLSKSSPVKFQAFVAGLSGHSLLTEHQGSQRGIEIELFPWTLSRLFGEAAFEFTQGIVNLEDIWGSDARLLIEQLGEMSNWQARFSLVDRILSSRIETSNRAVRGEIRWAWEQLERHSGCISIRHLAQTIGWSDRHFATCFRNETGVTPKVAARLIRFNCAQQFLISRDRYSLSEIAASCGYSDQSHFTREFRLFSGCSPTVYQNARFSDLPGTSSDMIRA